MPKGDAFFTIVTQDYFPFARSLFESVKKHHPNARCIALVVDGKLSAAAQVSGEIEVLHFSDWVKKDRRLRSLAARYKTFALCCALKPYAARRLISDHGVKKLVYLDSDIRVYAPMDFIFRLLDRHSGLITPHLVNASASLFGDRLFPSESSILMFGTYNMGFLALRADRHALRFLDWWEKRTFFRCEIRVFEGYFVDQKWADLIPGLFPEFHVLRHPGCNVGFWNLHERDLRVDRRKRVFCGKGRLIFFHFSGWSLSSPTIFSDKQNRYTLENRPELKPLVIDMASAVMRFSDFNTRHSGTR